MWIKRKITETTNKKQKKRIGLPLALVLIVGALAAAWMGLSLAGHSLEKPNGTPMPEETAQNMRDFDYGAVGALDPDSPEWAEEYGADHPKAVTPGVVPEDAPVGACTISISCRTAADKGMAAQERWRDIVPPGGMILAPVELEFRQGEMVFDVLKRAVRERDIQMEFNGLAGAQYVKGIHNLYELDGGPDSGWMYCVNGWYPNYGCGQYLVREGDVIEWNYTCDLGRDLGQDWILRK
jgi:hypothetical protein